jgi:hypothetical protein
MVKKYILTIFSLLGFFLVSFTSPHKVFAITFDIESYPTIINTSEPFNIKVSISGVNTGTNYLRVDLYKDGTFNYFGQTYNGTSWYTGSVWNSYFPVTVSGATVSATIQARVGSPTVTQYPGQGYYKLKVRRYTSDSSYSFSNIVDVQITENLETQTPIPTPTINPTSTPISTIIPTILPTTSPTPSLIPTETPTITSTPTVNPTPISTPFSTITPTPKLTASPCPIPRLEEHNNRHKYYDKFKRQVTKFFSAHYPLTSVFMLLRII